MSAREWGNISHKTSYLLHTLTDIPVHEGTLGVEEVEFVV